jgi:nigerose phosphorylase
MSWQIENDWISKESIPDNGNRLLVANGYLGIRGTLEEAGKEQLAAVNLAGIYDKVGDGWREPLNAPNPLYTRVCIDGKLLTALDGSADRHTQALDFRHGIYSRTTHWNSAGVTVHGTHIAHMGQEHLILSSFAVTADQDTELEIIAGIDTNIWEIYGPHYLRFDREIKDTTLLCTAPVQNRIDTVTVGRKCSLNVPAKIQQEGDRLVFYLKLKAGQSAELRSVCAVFTTHDCADPAEKVKDALAAADYDSLLQSHIAAWEQIWAAGAAEIDGDETAQDCLNYSLYHLNSIAPRSGKPLSIPARGLSGQTYKGAVFWDSEMFILDYFLYTQPDVARSMVMYRIETLPGALEKAKQYGWKGAFYAWESQEGGFDACSDYNVTDVFTGRPMRTFFKDKQVHISAAVARAIMAYAEVTGDKSILAQGGAETVLECARFYYSLLLRYADKEQWEIHDVIGPDEYHERVNNNAYTNAMAKKTMLWAVKAAHMLQETDETAYAAFAAKTGAETLLHTLAEAAEKLYLPQPNEDGIIEQFDGYFGLEDTTVEAVRSRLKDPKEYWGGAYGVASQTQVIKQADVITMLELCHEDYGKDVLKANWDYYCPRTEHGSSLSACMYALAACRWDGAEEALPFFQKSARADWDGGGKQWAGLVYIGGTHPAASGGAWKVFAQGFAGLETINGKPVLHPQLPKQWKRICFTCRVCGTAYRVTVTHEKGMIEKL